MKSEINPAPLMATQLIDTLCSYHSTPVDRVPQIPLYMDQVLSYLETTLEPLKREPGEPCFTKTMINNYVKAGVLKPPSKKKYDQRQLMALTIIYRLKGTLQMKDIESLMGKLTDPQVESHYQRFLQAESQANMRVTQRLSDIDLESSSAYTKEQLKDVLIDLAVEADAQRRLVEALIDRLKG